MGDEFTILDEGAARQLLRRATFDGSPRALAKAGIVGLSRGQAVDKLLPRRPARFAPGGRYLEQMHGRWLSYMSRSPRQLQSKLVLFWHDHFATAYAKVQDLKQMKVHVKTLYTHALGDFGVFVKAINRDPAMIEFLDTQRNRRKRPNENYAREFLELFTVGVEDLAGQPNYEQEDIVQIARAFTGWQHDGTRSFFSESQHDYEEDYPERGPKRVFPGAHGFPAAGASLTSNGEGAVEIDTVVDVTLAHRDSEGRNTVARRIAQRLLAYYAYPDPELDVIDAVVDRSGFDSSFDVAALLRAIFSHDAFYATASPASGRKSVKWPAHYLVGSMRMLGMKFRGGDPYLDGGSYSSAHDHITNMGQTLLDPPSVFGWDWETAWISTAALLARFRFARDLIASRDGPRRFRPEKFIDLALSEPGAILDAVLDALDVAHQVSSDEREVLLEYLTDGGTVTSLDLEDSYVRNAKLHGLIGLVLQSPAFQVV